MIWQKTSPKIIAKYDNGNHRVTLFSDGTKIKELKAQLDADESALEAKTARWEELEAAIAELQEN